MSITRKLQRLTGQPGQAGQLEQRRFALPPAYPIDDARDLVFDGFDNFGTPADPATFVPRWISGDWPVIGLTRGRDAAVRLFRTWAENALSQEATFEYFSARSKVEHRNPTQSRQAKTRRISSAMWQFAGDPEMLLELEADPDTGRTTVHFDLLGVEHVFKTLFIAFLEMFQGNTRARSKYYQGTLTYKLSYEMDVTYPNEYVVPGNAPTRARLAINRPHFSYSANRDPTFENDGSLRVAALGMASLVTFSILGSAAKSLTPADGRHDGFDYGGARLATSNDAELFGQGGARTVVRVPNTRIDAYAPQLNGSKFAGDLGSSLYTYAIEAWERLMAATDGMVIAPHVSRKRCLRNSAGMILGLCRKAASLWQHGHVIGIPSKCYAPKSTSGVKKQGKGAYLKAGIAPDAMFASDELLYVIEAVLEKGRARGDGLPVCGTFDFVVHRIFMSSPQIENIYPEPERFRIADGVLVDPPTVGETPVLAAFHLLATPGHVVPFIPRDALAENAEVIDLGRAAARTSHLIPIAGPRKRQPFKSVFVYDDETFNDKDGFEGRVRPYAAGCMLVPENAAAYGVIEDVQVADWVPGAAPAAPDDAAPIRLGNPHITQGETCLYEMLEYLWETECTAMSLLVAHNGSKFDHYHLIREILDRPAHRDFVAKLHTGPISKRGSRILSATFELRSSVDPRVFKTFQLRDTILYWPSSLTRLGENLGCETHKGEFVYEDVKSFEQYMHPDNQAQRDEVVEYLAKDVLLLCEICMKLPALYLELFKMDPLSKLSAASIAKEIMFTDPSYQGDIASLGFDADRSYRNDYTGGKNVNHIAGIIDLDLEKSESPEPADDDDDMVSEIVHSDATSMYPTMMALKTYPVGLPVIHSLDLPLDGTLAFLQEQHSLGEDAPFIALIHCSLKQLPPDGITAGPQLPQRAVVGVGTTRLVFAWGSWTGWMLEENLTFLLDTGSVQLADFRCDTAHIYRRGRPFKEVIERLFSLKRGYDRILDTGRLQRGSGEFKPSQFEGDPSELDAAAAAHELGRAAAKQELQRTSALRELVKLIINSAYGIFALKTTDTEVLEVLDSLDPDFLQAYLDSHRECHIHAYPMQTVVKTRGIFTSPRRNVSLSAAISQYSRMALYRKELLAARLPGCMNLYSDTDCIIVKYTRRRDSPSFMEELFASDPLAGVPRELGGWADENAGGHIIRVGIVGLKCYYYIVRYPDIDPATNKPRERVVLHARGWNRDWKFLKAMTSVVQTPEGVYVPARVFYLNYSPALFARRMANADSFDGPVSMTRHDMDDLLTGDTKTMRAHFYNFQGGSGVFLGADHTRDFSTRSITMLTNKGVPGELVSEPGSSYRPVSPFHF